MKFFFVRIAIVCMIFFLNTSFCYAWATFTDTANGFQIDFPCNPQKMGNNTKTHIINVYNCEESINGKLILYHVYLTAKSNGTAIRYKQSDVDLALKNYIIGGLQMYGVGQDDVDFHEISKFQNKFPAIYYFTNALKGGIIAEGISSLINGKHFKIGIMYEPSCKNEAKSRLKYFLNSYKLK